MQPAEIAGARQRLGLTQHGLAERIGVSRRTIEAWESGRRSPAGLYRKALETIMETDGRFSLHQIMLNGEPDLHVEGRVETLGDARALATRVLAEINPTDARRGVVIRDGERNGEIVARLRIDEWRLPDKMIEGPDWSFATIVSGMIDNPAFDPDGWR